LYVINFGTLRHVLKSHYFFSGCEILLRLQTAHFTWLKPHKIIGFPVFLIRELRFLFRRQLGLRGLVSAGVTFSAVLVFWGLTADGTNWWFRSVPELSELSTWLKSQNPWNLFLFIFIGVNAVNYAQQVQGVLVDRLNARVLIRISNEDLKSSEDPGQDSGKRRALLGGRRRVLESLIKFVPIVWSLAALAFSFFLLGHVWPALLLIFELIFILWFLPRMIGRFDRARDKPATPEEAPGDVQMLSPATDITREERRRRRDQAQDPIEKARISREKAEQNLAAAAERMMAIIDRPLVRIKVGWPAIVVAVSVVTAVTLMTIAEMTRSGDLPEKGTLLILLIILTSNIALRAAQASEDLAFFTSSLNEMNESEDGSESL
jgi:hypothetical protein